MIKFIKITIGVFLVVIHIYSCKPSDYYYGEYLKNGEIYYPGRVDSLTMITGNQRAILRFRVTTDPKVNTLKIYLQNSLSAEQQFLSYPIESNEYGQIRLIELDDLEEATYNAYVYTATAAGDSSRAVSTSQFIYGKSYRSTLANRSVSSINTTDASEPKLLFVSENNLPRQGTFYTMQFTEVKYLTTSGDSTTVQITPYETTASLKGIVRPSTIYYRTAYKPLETSLDYFYTDFKERSYPN